MTATGITDQASELRPKRADARRNYDKVITAARDAFAEGGAATSLEAIARRAEVGIGTLYRHFPTRHALIEAVYLDELESLCRSASELSELPPWDALVAWLHNFVGYLATKHALAEELVNCLGRDSQFFRSAREALHEAGTPLLERAQQAGVVRRDTNLTEVLHMIMGIAKIPAGDPGQTERILKVALDGLRYRDPTG